MLVEINLLPKKEKPNMTIYLIIFIVSLVTIVSGVFIYNKMNDAKVEIAKIEREIQGVKIEKAELEKKLSENTDGTSLGKLQGIVASVAEYPIHTVDVLNRMSRLLPKDGYIQSFGYTNEVITLVVDFPQHADATFYYTRLLGEAWIGEVNMSQISTKKEEEANAPYTAHYSVTLNKEKLKNVQKEGIVDGN